jgi:hypothetical protein
MTLNMLRTSRINPKLSAVSHIFGQYDFKRAPMAPPGTRTFAHETPERRRTWAPHGQDGWYIGPTLEHYRCYMVYITKTISNRIVETVGFFNTYIHLTISIISRFGDSVCSGSHVPLIKPATGGPILSGRRRTGDFPEAISENFHICKTKEYK